MKKLLLILGICTQSVCMADIVVKNVTDDLRKAGDINAAYWKNAPEMMVNLMAQPIVAPRPATTTTESLRVKAVSDGKWIAFLIKWKDADYSQAGKLGEFSDAVALQFPVKDNKAPPPVFMGAKDDPVHIFHWRAQYQADAEHGGRRKMEDIYPNMATDMYPMEFKDSGKLNNLTDKMRETYAPAQALGNPQSYAKKGVDEIFAEGFGTSTLASESESGGRGVWKNGEWSVVITRALERAGGSVIPAGGESFVSFAVWQGGKDEVGSRKSLIMEWVPLKLESK